MSSNCNESELVIIFLSLFSTDGESRITESI